MNDDCVLHKLNFELYRVSPERRCPVAGFWGTDGSNCSSSIRQGCNDPADPDCIALPTRPEYLVRRAAHVLDHETRERLSREARNAIDELYVHGRCDCRNMGFSDWGLRPGGCRHQQDDNSEECGLQSTHSGGAYLHDAAVALHDPARRGCSQRIPVIHAHGFGSEAGAGRPPSPSIFIGMLLCILCPPAAIDSATSLPYSASERSGSFSMNATAFHRSSSP
jgi:hypothetical protein